MGMEFTAGNKEVRQEKNNDRQVLEKHIPPLLETLIVFSIA